jgi:hypothetical protein
VDPLPRLFSAALSLDSIDPDIDPIRHTRALVRRAARRAIADIRERRSASGAS